MYMFPCTKCDRTFETQRGLNGHQVAHKEGQRYKKSRRQTPSTYNCQECSIECTIGYSKDNKFCSNRCQQDWMWKNITIPRIESGKATHNSYVILKRYLEEKVGNVCSECGQTQVWNGKPLTLQVDHKDGDSDNNFPSNIRLLCPNCHTQTETFGTKGKGSRYKKVTKRNQYICEYRGSLAQR